MPAIHELNTAASLGVRPSPRWLGQHDRGVREESTATAGTIDGCGHPDAVNV
jgi:hypothetical protein